MYKPGIRTFRFTHKTEPGDVLFFTGYDKEHAMDGFLIMCGEHMRDLVDVVEVDDNLEPIKVQ